MSRICPRAAARIFAITTVAVAMVFTTSCETGPDLSNVNRSAASPNSSNAEKELSGDYLLTGTDETGKAYDGVLAIANQGSAYKLTRTIDRTRFTGVGVQAGDAVGAAYAEADQGKGCGVALYKISPNGSLDGKIARWGEITFGEEKAVRSEGTGFNGKYDVSGTAADGKKYSGSIKIDKTGDGYLATWSTSLGEFVGFGVWRGDRAAIGFGGKQCTFAIYKVSGRSLEGYWGSQRAISFGTENAKVK